MGVLRRGSLLTAPQRTQSRPAPPSLPARTTGQFRGPKDDGIRPADRRQRIGRYAGPENRHESTRQTALGQLVRRWILPAQALDRLQEALFLCLRQKPVAVRMRDCRQANPPAATTSVRRHRLLRERGLEAAFAGNAIPISNWAALGSPGRPKRPSHPAGPAPGAHHSALRPARRDRGMPPYCSEPWPAGAEASSAPASAGTRRRMPKPAYFPWAGFGIGSATLGVKSTLPISIWTYRASFGGSMTRRAPQLSRLLYTNSSPSVTI